jgi:hypothetical protein
MVQARLTFVVAITQALFAASQDISVSCGSTSRASIISDDTFQSANVRNGALTGLKDTICNFRTDGACPGGLCVLEVIIRDGNNDVSLKMNKTLTIGPNGGNAELGPCSSVMVSKMFSASKLQDAYTPC